MNPTVPTPSATSTVTSTSGAPCTFQPFNILEISLISAQDLPQVSKSMRTYAIVWIHPNHKLTTRIDHQGYNNPTWNDRFTYRVGDELIDSDEAAVNVEIYTLSWFRDVHVGSVRVLISDLINPYVRNSTRFVALQIRRPSSNPQGKLNMGIALMDGSKRSMPMCREINSKGVDFHDKIGHISDEQQKVHDNVHIWRSNSVGTFDINEEFLGKEGSVCNGSMVNGSICNGSMVYGSELCSDVGPSASIVAAEIAQNSRNRPPIEYRPTNMLQNKEELLDNKGNSIVMDITVEEARAKGLASNIARWKKEVSMKHNNEDDENIEMKDHESTRRHSRRHSDGGLSCFGSALGFEFRIVCGSSKPKETKSERKRLTFSEANSD